MQSFQVVLVATERFLLLLIVHLPAPVLLFFLPHLRIAQLLQLLARILMIGEGEGEVVVVVGITLLSQQQQQHHQQQALRQLRRILLVVEGGRDGEVV